MFNKGLFLIATLAITGSIAHAAPSGGKFFDRVMFVIFENTNYSEALKQPFFKQLAGDGASFSNLMALTHPSQGNYVALTSGSLNGVTGDGKYDLNVDNIVDLLEAKGFTWKVYVEDYPGNCFIGTTSGSYARKHNPFISYVDIQNNPSRCANIVEASQFDEDAASGRLPNYVFYVPNNKNSGHDTNVSYADKWYRARFSKYLGDSQFMANTVLISTFDESGHSPINQIYTSIVGPGVKPGVYGTALTLSSILQLVEENWNLGDLGKLDAKATPVPNIWKK